MFSAVIHFPFIEEGNTTSPVASVHFFSLG